MKMPARLVEAVQQSADSRTYPDGVAYRSISVSDVRRLSAESGLSGRQIELMALAEEILPERYARNRRKFSLEDQVALLKSNVTVIGLGGLGGAVTEILARIGIGGLRLVDGDRFEDSNLNRQFLSTGDTIGQSKAATAQQRVAAINPSVEVTPHQQFLTRDNGGQFLEDAHMAVDCLDNLPARFWLEAACKSKGCPLVSAAVAGTTGQVTTIYPADLGLRLIYGDPDKAPLKGAESSLGTLPYAVTALAALECAEVIKIILKRDNVLRNKLLIADFDDAQIEVMQLT
jgi:molybdopterin/thiamine biosynthesis adenylyltransferase